MRKFVVDILHEAPANDDVEIRKAIRRIHCRLQSGTLPRAIFTKFGRSLFLNLDRWEEYLASDTCDAEKSVGNPRNVVSRRGRPRKNDSESYLDNL